MTWYGPGSDMVNFGTKPSWFGSTKASNDDFKPPFWSAVNGWTVTLILCGKSVAPGLKATFVTILKEVGSPTIGSFYLMIIFCLLSNN